MSPTNPALKHSISRMAHAIGNVIALAPKAPQPISASTVFYRWEAHMGFTACGSYQGIHAPEGDNILIVWDERPEGVNTMCLSEYHKLMGMIEAAREARKAAHLVTPSPCHPVIP